MSNRRVGPFSSYKSLFKIQHVIYKLGNIRLWGFGVSFDQLITGAVVALILSGIYTVFPLLNYFFINKWIVIIIATLASMWASARYELGGKSILMWTIGIIMWSVRGKYVVRGKIAKKPKYKKEGIYLYAASRHVEVADNGSYKCVSPAIIKYTDLDFVKLNSPHKVKFNPSQNIITVAPIRKQKKGAVGDGEMVLFPKKKTSVLTTPNNSIILENTTILAQPAPSPKKVLRHKPKYGMAIYAEDSNV